MLVWGRSPSPVHAEQSSAAHSSPLEKIFLLAILPNICPTSRPSTTMHFPRNLAQPLQLQPELLNNQADHPDGLMETVAHLFTNRAQCYFLASQLLLQEFPPPFHLPLKYAGPRLP